MKKILPLILVTLLLLGGIGVLFYPSISNWVNGLNQSRAIQQYSDTVQQMDTSSIEDYWRQARAYNESFTDIYKTASGESLGKRGALDNYQSVLNIGSVMGHIEIPCIGVHLPIYHGVGESSLQRGVGHIPQTHLPIGGPGSHSVLTSHRAMATSDLFNNLDQLIEGDRFYLYVLDDILAYEVDQILVVEPEETGALLPINGGDYVTLVTCTPYAVNSHRLLVRGTRVPYIPEEPGEIPAAAPVGPNLHTVILLLFLVLWMILGLAFWRTRRRRLRHYKYPAPRRRRGKKGFLILIILLLAAGLFMILFPTLCRYLYDRQAAQVIDAFEQARTEDINEADPLLLERIREYNRSLYENGQENKLQDPFAFEQPNAELAELGYADEIIGYLIVEKMDTRLPVYLGASQENMGRGAAHLTYTSIPVGGENTHAVIIGHRNLMRAEMFREIQLLEPGDEVIFVNRWEELIYTVTGTEIISPEETEHLLIQPGRDLLTLATCHPKGQNTSRYLVYCERKTSISQPIPQKYRWRPRVGWKAKCRPKPYPN